MNVDFSRQVYCLLGIPVDHVTVVSTVAKLRQAAQNNQRLFLSTPNVNFLATAQKNSEFRRSLLESDLSVADGMAVVLLARLFGIHLPERVAGSDVFDTLRRHAPPSLRVFFFGADEVAGQAALTTLSDPSGGLIAVGHINPGFGDVMQMSDPNFLTRINNSGAQFVVVSVGAAKGQAWIRNNRHHLNAPLIAYLGAVVHFVSGGVIRAPKRWQTLGLEWLWRIVQEPNLWKRYALDAMHLFGLLATKALPFAVLRTWQRLSGGVDPPTGEILRSNGTSTLALSGTLTDATRESFAPLFRQLAESPDAQVRINLSNVQQLDCAFGGLVLLLEASCLDRGAQLQLVHFKTSHALALRCIGLAHLTLSL
jgi:N-acetylglucosaminyldiphosphoundecaprenol N-acetyl-beta-D-mannosaminyltransferase